MWTKAKPCCRDSSHALLVACACISPEDRTTEGEDVKYEYLTEEQWVIREKLLGNCGSGTDEQKRDAALASFKAAIMDKGRKTKKYQGVWLVGVFAGITERLSTESSRFHGMKRLKTIADIVDFDAASSMKVDDEIEIAGWKQQLEASKASHMISPNKVSVPDGLARTPLSTPTERPTSPTRCSATSCSPCSAKRRCRSRRSRATTRRSRPSRWRQERRRQRLADRSARSRNNSRRSARSCGIGLSTSSTRATGRSGN